MSDGVSGSKMPATNTATSRRFMEEDEYSGRMCTVDTYRNVPPEKISSKATYVVCRAPARFNRKNVTIADNGATLENHKMVCRTANTAKQPNALRVEGVQLTENQQRTVGFRDPKVQQE
jgi:hypothetical protein